MNRYDEDEPGFFQRYGVVLGIGVAFLLIGGVLAFFLLSGSHPSVPKKQDLVQIKLLPPPVPPPPPPPPPPPLPVPPPPEKVVEQPPVKPNEPKPDDKPKLAKADLPPGPAGPKTSGPGDAFGLPGSGNGGDGIGGEGGGTRFGWYASEVQNAVHSALANNAKTRDAAIRSLKIRIWADNTGRVTRATVAGTADDPAVAAAIQNEVLHGLQLPEPPPNDMPMPIIMQLREVRPN